jgi:hypothetical protein
MSQIQAITQESLGAIVTAIQKYQVSGIDALPGSGKSTTIPVHLVNAGATMMVVEPTVLSCTSLQKYVSTLFEEKGIVGYAAEGKAVYNNTKIDKIRDNTSDSSKKQTKLCYCTGGHVMNLLLDCIKYANTIRKSTGADTYKGIKLNFVEILMVDEAHNGIVESDMVMYLYRYLKIHGAILPRLLLSSATLGVTDTPFPDTPVYKIPIKIHDIEDIYHTRDYKSDDRVIYKDVAFVVKDFHTRMPVPQKETDSWLIFCAGRGEVDDVVKHLSGIENVEILAVFGNQDSGENEKIFSPISPGIRRIVISTNIAEVSITIDGLSGVFCTMTEKYMQQTSTTSSRLVTKTISKSSAHQRRGRTGRTRKGFCYRMITESTFQTLPENRPRELERISLNDTIIKIFDANIDPIKFFNNPKISTETIEDAWHTLSRLSMCTSRPVKVTHKGHFSTYFPYSVFGSSLLYEWVYTKPCLPDGQETDPLPIWPGIVVISLIESFGPNYFWYPSKNNKLTISENQDIMLEHYETYFSKYEGDSDLAVLCSMWAYFQEEFNDKIKRGNLKRWEVSKYCSANGLNNKKMWELYTNMVKTMNNLNRVGDRKCYVEDFDYEFIDVIIMTIVPFIMTTYSESIFTAKKKNYVNTLDKSSYYSLDRRNPVKHNPPHSETIVALATHQAGGNKKITLFVPCGESIGVDMVQPTSMKDITIGKFKKKRSKSVQKEPTIVKEFDILNIAAILPGFSINRYDTGESLILPDIGYSGELPKTVKYNYLSSSSRVVKLPELPNIETLTQLEPDFIEQIVTIKFTEEELMADEDTE